MTRRQLLTLLAAPHRVGYREYAKCLPDYLHDLAERAYQTRNHAIGRLTSGNAIRERQRWVRDTFWKLVGGMPERTPLNPRTMGALERPGYRLEKIVYESVPQFHIPANLYIPAAGQPPYPGVLFQMGHSANGKAYDAYQRCCQALARLGYLVLAFDPMGQGERVYYPGFKAHRTRLRSSDDEHTRPGRQMLLLGDTATRLQVWDAMRSLDFLASHPLVDPKRLASTGQSGGGTLTMLLAGVDDRLSAAVVSMGNTENFACAGFNPPGSTDDAEQNFPGGGPLGFDRWDLLYPLAPKPLLVGVSAHDFFGTYSTSYIANGWEEFQKLRKVYERLGYPDRIAWEETPLPHGLSYDSRLSVYNWFGRWLKGDTAPVKAEPEVTPEPDEMIWVSASGSVVKSFGSRTPFVLNRDRVLQSRDREGMALEELLHVERSAAAAVTLLSQVPSRSVDVAAIEIPSAPKVWVPAWLFLPERMKPDVPVLILLEPSGRNLRWREGDLYQTIAGHGTPVCVPDLRGVGDCQPELGRGAARYARSHNDDEQYAWASLILGRPLLGQRVTDALAVVAALSAFRPLAGRKLVVAAQGMMTVPAVFAAALEPRISALYLAGGIVSLRSIIDTENYSHPFANFVPRLLLHTDLPETVAALAPRAVTLAGPVDAAGHAAPDAEVRKQYASARNVRLEPQAEWSVEALRRVGARTPRP